MKRELSRRSWLRTAAAGLGAAAASSAVPARRSVAQETSAHHGPLVIKDLKVTPIALPDPPIMASSGCHGPYFLRHVVELQTDGGIIGWGETTGGERMTAALEKARAIIKGRDAFAYRAFAKELTALAPGCFAAVELACLDAAGQALGCLLAALLGGPVRDRVEFAAYLFFRYAADHPVILADKRVVDGRGKGDKALDDWGEVRTPEAMAEMAAKFREKFGFRFFKLKAGVLAPEAEAAAMRAMNERFEGKCPLRIDPNARWKMETALRIGNELKKVNLEYYEDPVRGQQAMAEVRTKTGLAMSTNMCVTRFSHIPEALRVKPIDVLLADHHYWGGLTSCQALGPICDLAGWRMSQHSNSHAGVAMAAMIHLGAVVPQLTCASDTHYPWLVEGADIIEGPKLAIREGKMDVPRGPGLGVRVDRDKLARAHETYQKCGMRERDDATLMKRLEPGWTGAPL